MHCYDLFICMKGNLTNDLTYDQSMISHGTVNMINFAIECFGQVFNETNKKVIQIQKQCDSSCHSEVNFILDMKIALSRSATLLHMTRTNNNTHPSCFYHTYYLYL